MADRELLVRIIGDDRDLQRALTGTERKVASVDNRMASFGKNVTRAFGAAGIALGTASLLQGMSAAIDAASGLNEQISRTEAVLGESAAAMIEWSQTTASAMGISQRAALEASAGFAGLFQTVGVDQQKAGALSRQLVQLAADLASLQDTTPEQALLALRSALVGESEPLRRYNVFLSEARVQQQAMAATGKESAKALTNQEKVLARLNIIMRDSVQSRGNFAATSGDIANLERKAAAEAENLAANLGKALAPAMDIALTSSIALTSGINDLIAGMADLRGALRDSDFFDGFNEGVEDANDRAAGFFQLLRDNIPLLDEAARLRNAVVGGGKFGGIQPGEGGAQRAASRAARAGKDAKEIEREAIEAERAQARARKAFDGFLKGLGLKLDRAGLTTSLNNDLAVLREIERAIRKRIRAEGRTFTLVQQLTDVQLQIASTIESQQANAQQRQTDAIEKKIDAQESADERRRNRIRQRQERRQRNQFEDLGLTGEGDKAVPGVGALRRRLGNVRQAVEGTVLDTKKTDAQLDNIAKVLSDKYRVVGKEVREAILQMFNDISGALGEGDKKVGPLTKTSSLNSRKIVAGLGLSPEEINALRGRLSNFNSAGVGLAGSNNRLSGGGFTGGTGFVIELHTDINVDGQKMASVVQRHEQKNRRRNPKQKRGPNRNR